jgi:hypothetical protein
MVAAVAYTRRSPRIRCRSVVAQVTPWVKGPQRSTFSDAVSRVASADRRRASGATIGPSRICSVMAAGRHRGDPLIGHLLDRHMLVQVVPGEEPVPAGLLCLGSQLCDFLGLPQS